LVSLQTLFGDDARILRDREYQILLLVTVPVLLGTTLLSPVLDSLIGPLGATPATVGLLISAFTAPAIAIIPLAGALADRVGRKPILVVSILLFGCAGSAIALTSDFRVALFLRFLQGVSFAGASPIIITSIRDIYDGSAEATGQGLRAMVSGLGQTVFSPLAGLLVVVAWQAPFVMDTTSPSPSSCTSGSKSRSAQSGWPTTGRMATAVRCSDCSVSGGCSSWCSAGGCSWWRGSAF
jgi:ACDE family multidrug resistance protein